MPNKQQILMGLVCVLSLGLAVSLLCQAPRPVSFTFAVFAAGAAFASLIP